MGSGDYSLSARASSGRDAFYKAAPASEIFKEKTINTAMNPSGVKLRESRDSKEHPTSLAIVLALDVTGSMGSIPHFLVKEGLPHVMEDIIKSGIKDPQVLFLGIGDHECDSFPLQVSQFESSDELLDKWLTTIYLEGGGGGNEGESYPLAWYFAGKHTSIDCWEKRKEKGFLFTIGDEPYLRSVPKTKLHEIMGDGQYSDMDARVLLDKAKETYNVFHILIRETSAGSRDVTINSWKQLLGDNVLVAQSHTQVHNIIAETIKKYAKMSSGEKIAHAGPGVDAHENIL